MKQSDTNSVLGAIAFFAAIAIASIIYGIFQKKEQFGTTTVVRRSGGLHPSFCSYWRWWYYYNDN